MMAESKENIDPDVDDIKPLKRKKKNTVEPCKRFKPPTDKEEIDVITKGYIPENTRKSTSWALKVFNEWRYSRESEERNCPDNLLETGNNEELNYWLPRFINEVRRTDGNPYPPRSIHQLLAGLQRYMLEQNYCLPKFLDRQNQQFRPIHGACDSVYHSLHCSGVGASIRHTAIISEDEEKKLWEYGILGLDNPKSLQRAVFYFIGKRFCICGGEEQRNLSPAQFIRSYNPDCITYVEHGSKNYSATTLFQKLVPEKVTGHRSLEALRTYENISTDQHKEVSKVLMSNLKSSQSVQVAVNPMSGFLGGINGCSIGNITVNFPSE